MSIPRYDTLSLPAYGRPIPLRDSSNLQSEFNILTRKSSSFVASVPGEEGGAIVALTSLLRRDEFWLSFTDDRTRDSELNFVTSTE